MDKSTTKPFDPTKISFAIIHHRGEQNEAVTADGYTVRREQYLPFEDRLVATASYDSHFIYVDPMFKKIIGRWQHMCSCGSAAVVVGYNAYAKDASPSIGGLGLRAGELLVCLIHAQTGKHADGNA